MMLVWLLEAIAYAVLAAGVIIVNWHRPVTRRVGATLLIFSLVSSATFFVLPFDLRVVREILLVTAVGTMSAIALIEGDDHRPHQIVLAAAALDLAFCGALCLVGSSEPHIRSLFGWVVNIVFVVMSLAVAWPGVRDVFRGWIAAVDRERRLDTTAPDIDWAIRRLDRD